jgi:acyl carrier protein
MNTTTTAGVAERLRLCLPRHVAGVTEYTRLQELELDSMDTVEYLCAIHQEFGVSLSEAEFQPDQTVGGLIKLIGARAPEL